MLNVESIIMDRWGGLPNFHKRNSREEWHCGCPARCGGDPSTTDRFVIQFNADSGIITGWCRQCGHTENIFPDGHNTSRMLTSEELAEMREAARIKEEQIREEASERLDYYAGRIDEFHEMSSSHRELWHKHWVADWSMDYYRLGFMPDKTIGKNETGEWIKNEALVIPVWSEHWTLDNVQFRLLNPPNPHDKYRQVSGLPVGLFHTQPDIGLSGTVVVTEGIKKAICLNQVVLSATGELMNIIAIPSSKPPDELILKFNNVERMYLILDPDTRVPTPRGTIQDKVISKFIELNPNLELFPVNIPTKIDDFFYRYGFKFEDFEPYLTKGRPVLRGSADMFSTLKELRGENVRQER